MIPEEGGATRGGTYNPVRGARVIATTEAFLDQAVSLEQGSFSDVTRFSLEETAEKNRLVASLANKSNVGLAEPGQFVGFNLLGTELSSFS